MSTASIEFSDRHPHRENFEAALIEGLSKDPKRLPPKFFYDEHGSRLFEQICAQPEYYPPTAERQIFSDNLASIADCIGPDTVLIEPGAGSNVKIRWLLAGLQPRAYVPIDISGEHLRESATALAADFPHLPIYAVCADFTHELVMPEGLSSGRKVVFFPGSTLGNFEPAQALVFMREMRQLVGDDGGLLIGVDREKDHQLLERAYNDAAGITAAFNLNVLERAKRELGADIDPAKFQHQAFYNPASARIEMHLKSLGPQSIGVNGNRFELAAGETIHTENSYKYSPERLLKMGQQAGFTARDWWTDPEELFGVYFFEACA